MVLSTGHTEWHLADHGRSVNQSLRSICVGTSKRLGAICALNAASNATLWACEALGFVACIHHKVYAPCLTKPKDRLHSQPINGRELW